MKKKLSAILLTLAMTVSLLALPVSADSSDILARGTCGDNLTWTLTEGGTLTISGTGDMWDFEYDEDTGELNIPWSDYTSMIESLVVQEGVTSIGDWAFSDCYNMTSAVLEEGIVSIGDYAFWGYKNLTDVTLSDGLQSIGDEAFFGCFLESINLPDTLTSMGTKAFSYTRLTSIVVPASVTTIGNGLFYGCSRLEYVIFEGSAPDVVEYDDWDPSEWFDSKGYGGILETEGDSLIVYYPADGTWTEEVQHYFFYADRDLYTYTYTYYDEEDGVYYTIEDETIEDEIILTDITWVSYDANEYDALVEFLSSEHFSDDYGTGTGSWSWASTYIYACYDAGIITGYEDGDSYSFLPANNLTRAEAATIIARAYGLTADDDAASAFSDVSSDYWASTYIEACVEAGIINGYEDGTFMPAQNVTRVELAKMIAVAEGLALDASESSFSDVEDTHWGVPYIEACADAGIVNGYTDGTFLPSSNVTRAEAATMIARALGLTE